jgi:hypothetical protein
MFETLPGISDYDSRRPVSMGDGGDRDKQLSSRRILAAYYRDDPEHRVVHAFNETTPHSSVGNYAYKDLLWRDESVPTDGLSSYKLSHYSPGPGHLHARSSWDEDATYLFFKASDRYTSHQHLDVGHFTIYRGLDELAGDGGHYDGFGTDHDVNYHLRSIAHSTVLVHNPDEIWPGIRAGHVRGNDGGQHHRWPHHNGAVADAAAWRRGEEVYDIADVIAYQDYGDYLYIAADGARAYSPAKLRRFTRQILFLRPGTFVIVDRVESTDPAFEKTWLLQAGQRPQRRGEHLVISNGDSRLFVQTLLPASPVVALVDGDALYCYGGERYPPVRDTGPAPECRVQISPPVAATGDWFVHVLTATDADVTAVPGARVDTARGNVIVSIGDRAITFPAEPSAAGLEMQTAVHEEPGAAQPAAVHLQPNYPNPFNSGTQIRFQLPGPAPVRLTLFDVQGRAVATLLQERRAAGSHTVAWDGRDARGESAASGVYVCRLQAGSLVTARKLLLLR